jgi:hypothetical protein
VTKDQAEALRQLLEEIQRMGEGCQWKKWGYFGPQGWAGSRLWAVLREAETQPSEPRPF